MLNITDMRVENKIPPILRLGFRPFFLAAIYAIIAIVVWVFAFQNGQPSDLNVPALWWHVHEMFLVSLWRLWLALFSPRYKTGLVSMERRGIG